MTRRILRGSAVAALVMSGAMVSPAASYAQAPTADGARCVEDAHGHDDARVGHGTDPARDPNTLSQAQVDAMEGRAARIVAQRGVTAREDGTVTVPVHVHVLVRDNGSGDVAGWRIKRQIAVLNEAFSGRTSADAVDTPFRFRLVSVDRVRNTDWYNMDEQDSLQARRALRIGDARHLNFYVTNFAGDLEGLLGFATFPASYSSAPKLDGAVMLNESLPGGDAVFGKFNYALGDTAVHEVGHWMNLYHTFQGSCSDTNDYVTDTPLQKADTNVFYCNPNQNTCGGPDTPKDPVKNFMNYVDDECMNQFTWGQRDRMDISWYIRQALSG